MIDIDDIPTVASGEEEPGDEPSMALHHAQVPNGISAQFQNGY
jgi:hypothetical protein